MRISAKPPSRRELSATRCAAIALAAVAMVAAQHPAAAGSTGTVLSTADAQSTTAASQPTAITSDADARAGTSPVAVPPDAVQPEDVSAIARELNCPICQGYNLQDCPLEVCAQMRELIREQLAAGQTPEQIKDAFVAEYGPQVLNAPPTQGVFLAAWVAPVLVLLGGAFVLVTILVRSRRWPTRAEHSGEGARRRDAADDEPARADGGEPQGGERPDGGASYADRLEHMLDEDST